MADEIRRQATCSCGGLRVTVAGEPDIVVACNCLACQRRSGSPFGVGAYFRTDRISAVKGAHTSFQREADSGRALTNNFCPTCGNTVFWTLEMRPEQTGIALGAFASPDFPAPARIVWAEHQHHWISFPDGIPHFDQAAL